VRGTVEVFVLGPVQCPGFLAKVSRMAMACGLDGNVRNQGDGVLVRLSGMLTGIDTFRTMLVRQPPPLSRIDSIALRRLEEVLPQGFSILQGEASRLQIQRPDELSLPAANIRAVSSVSEPGLTAAGGPLPRIC
jgi:hydrogenase maturation protein HypF